MTSITKFFLFSFLLFQLCAFAQVPKKTSGGFTFAGGRYSLKETVSVERQVLSESGEPTTVSVDEVANSFVEIVSIDDTDVYYTIVGETEIQSMPKTAFFLSTKQLFQRYKGAKVGAYTIPFRLRGSGDNFDFEASLSLQTNLVVGFGKKESQESWFDVSAGIGVTSINLTEDNSNVTENRTATALTLSLGTVFKFDEFANLGIFIGGDFLGKSDRSVDWVYNKNLWIGVGLNISFTRVETDEPAENE